MVGINECGKTTILQAIYCFDFINDKEYESRHITNTLNLYQTIDNDPIIKAQISITYKVLIEIFDRIKGERISEVQSQVKANPAVQAKLANKLEELENIQVPFSKSEFQNSIHILRNLRTDKYSIEEFDFPEGSRISSDDLSKAIVRKLPYILYNDDFIDRPPTTVELPSEKPEMLTGWLSIYERLFKETDDQYSLFNLVKEPDARRRDAIISDVQEKLNKTLSKAWRTFLLKNQVQALNVKLTLEKDGESGLNILKIQIVEKLGSKERFFDIVDRSKGFLWFFNFVMKLEFNPKIIGNKKDTLYLLDEPGSYLHSSAQEKLCQKIKDISEKHGNVIYCTHSHNLLDPQYIPLNFIYIVQKDNKKNIDATPLPQVNLGPNSINAYQPIHEALQSSVFDSIDKNLPVIAVEGIYDKYAIQLFDKNSANFAIIPGTNANSIVKNIQFLNGFGKNYVAIWDNDKEGRKEYENAKKIFGEVESNRFIVLPSKENGNRKMEDMFVKTDLEMLGNELLGIRGASYEKIISSLYFSKEKRKEQLINSCSSETQSNFQILSKIIDKKFEEIKGISED